MKTSKISKIVSVNERNKWEHWPVFYITMDLENNETITLWKKKKDAFKVWDSVSYEVVEEWKRWKEVKENPFQQKQAFNQQQNIWAMVGMAMKLAFEQLYDKSNYNETLVLAKRIFEDAMRMYESYWKDTNSNQEQKEEKDDLPF